MISCGPPEIKKSDLQLICGSYVWNTDWSDWKGFLLQGGSPAQKEIIKSLFSAFFQSKQILYKEYLSFPRVKREATDSHTRLKRLTAIPIQQYEKLIRTQSKAFFFLRGHSLFSYGKNIITGVKSMSGRPSPAPFFYRQQLRRFPPPTSEGKLPLHCANKSQHEGGWRRFAFFAQKSERWEEKRGQSGKKTPLRKQET